MANEDRVLSELLGAGYISNHVEHAQRNPTRITEISYKLLQNTSCRVRELGQTR